MGMTMKRSIDEKLLKQAFITRRCAQRLNIADHKFTELFHEKYGEMRELPDGIVELVRYGNGEDSELTIEMMDDDVKLENKIMKCR